MSFFGEVPEPEVSQPEEPPPVVELPDWAGPPDRVVPRLSDRQLVMFQTDEVAMTVDRFELYPTGLLFTVSTFVRHPVQRFTPMPWELDGPPSGGNLDGFLRLGVLFADGTRWTNIDEHRTEKGDEPSIVASMQEGSSGPIGSSATFWLWPVPPPGPVTFVVTWPQHDVNEVRQAVDLAEPGHLPGSPVTLWPD